MRRYEFRCLWIITVLCVLLVGCNAENPADTVFTSGGKIYLNVDSVITITYDAEGKVTTVSPAEENASVILGGDEDYTGRDCAEVILALLEKMEKTGHLSEDSSIHVSFEESSNTLQQELAQNLAQKVDEALTDHNWNADVEVVPPVTEGTIPTQPSNGPSVPDGAQIQEDGTYILVQYVNALNNVVDQSKAVNTLTTVFSKEGYILSSELVALKTGYLRQAQTYAYDGDLLISVTSQQFDKNGNFQSHTTEYFDPSGVLLKRVDYKKDGTVDGSTEYVYFENGAIHFENAFYADGVPSASTEYDSEKHILSIKKWHPNGVLNEELLYSNGSISTQAIYDSEGDMNRYSEFWPNGKFKLQKSLGFFYNEEHVAGWCVYEFDENEVCIHDLITWPDGTVFQEIYYYPSGNIKSQYLRVPSNTYNPEYYAEFHDGVLVPYTGWNIIDGVKVYFGEALQEQNPDKIYDDRGNLLYYSETVDGYTYEVTQTYDDQDRRVTKEILGEDGSREYSENGQTTQGWGLVYSERTGRYCSEPDAVREIYDYRTGMHHYESYYQDGSSRIMVDSESGKPYYLAYLYADGRREIYEYDEGELTYMYIECENGTIIEQGTPRGN